MKTKFVKFAPLVALAVLCTQIQAATACTGITLQSDDGAVIVARTMDWSRAEMPSFYLIAPRGYVQQSILPNNDIGGMTFAGKYGFAGLGMEMPEFIIDGVNEVGLSAALFYFPEYGKYIEYDPTHKSNTLSDAQVVPWILSQFSTIDQVKSAIQNIRIVHVDPRIDTLHWRITEPSGRQVILEIVNGVATFYDSEIGVFTNAPEYPWHIKNLNNYVKLHPGAAGPIRMGPITLRAFGAGSGLLGLPGDFTPPSRFVRATFLQEYSLKQRNGRATAMAAFHILNNFDVPLGVQFAQNTAPNDMPSATQWTVATDTKNKILYYHTMYNRTIRELDLSKLDFETIPFQIHPLDKTQTETIIPAQVKQYTPA